jgi:glycosyltransferase involved in cell wall biosynthesis
MIDNQKSAVITFLGNAYHDSRVVNLIESLNDINIDTTTISFDWKTDNFKTQKGKTAIYKLDKSKSSLAYYFRFLFLLIRDLLKYKADFYFAEDIYTLPIVYFFAKLNKAKIYYNSREIYAHLAGLRNKNIVQKLIAKIESKFIRKVNMVLVTGEMDANYLKEVYSIDNLFVLRNLPKYIEHIKKIDLREKLNIPQTDRILLYQGVILEGRGILKLINLLHDIPNVHFVIVGEGEYRKQFEQEVSKSEVSDKIHFIGAVNHSDLLNYTACADIGITLIENISISYYYALPNKLFEYIMVGVPVLASNLPQMKNIIDQYQVGKYVNPENEDEVVKVILEMLNNEENLNRYQSNCENASKELNWEVEFNKFKEFLLN